MCGRYTQTAGLDVLRDRFLLDQVPAEVLPRYNIAPGQDAPVVLTRKARCLEALRWGLIPGWAKNPAIGSRLINARCETALEKPAFRQALERRRCLVPADGFYEWKGVGRAKLPFRFHRRDKEPFAFAGIWDAWKDPEGPELRTFAILTTEANSSVRPVHPRMPVILYPEDEAAWLDAAATPEDLLDGLAPYPPDALTAYPVSRRLNSAQNDDRSLIEPVADPQPEFDL
ncbi:MAG: hypothetical protein A2X36_01860 [Elusimicrobia bacterium GWA2_69_24]|nr:MAG: hypothetical protein A2X36_01860 [Elusimicrobia bacterium GWA2_69_24]HBL16889.1 hypothetical protein [Elusimicrobiota bacterium]